MKKENVNYTLYLVTDSTPAILSNRNICHVVEEALKGGVTCVQYRDKTSDTGDLIRTAGQLHSITKRYGVPLLINDRVDVALAVGCEGVHVGQDDMKLKTARKLLGPDAIIGATASTLEEAVEACRDGADYLGIGTIYATSTKTNTKNIIGIGGLRDILHGLAAAGWSHVPAVCIGGINASNIQEVLSKSAIPGRRLEGAAIVSGIMASDSPEDAAKQLLGLIKSVPKPEEGLAVGQGEGRYDISSVADIIKAVHETTPLSHNMTNLVVQNFAANVALAVGASPIMSNNGDEAEDLTRLQGALVINMGTVTRDSMENYLKALEAYNKTGGPVVYDPVGAGATSLRRRSVRTIMGSGRVDVLKGNEGEIRTVFGETDPSGSAGPTAQQRGVDSTSTLSPAQKAALVSRLAQRFGNVVVMTGRTDFVSDGRVTVAIDNGHEYLGAVTGTGCVLGTTISATLAAAGRRDAGTDQLAAVVAAILLFEIAAETAAERADVQGPGTFSPAFIDELARLRKATAQGDVRWLERARVRTVAAEE